MSQLLNLHAPTVRQHLQIPPREEWPQGAEIVRMQGLDILWCSQRKHGGRHLEAGQLQPYRQIGDPEVDAILHAMDEEGTPLGRADDLLQMAFDARDVPASQRTQSQHLMVAFLQTYATVPSWVDWEQLRRGQEVYQSYSAAIGFSLYYGSLIAGFSIPPIAAVILSTAYLAPPAKPSESLQRLLDTHEMSATCAGMGLPSIVPPRLNGAADNSISTAPAASTSASSSSSSSSSPLSEATQEEREHYSESRGGIGWRTALYVRILHAKVRHGILKKQGMKQWDTEKLGIPINMEDTSATLLAFSTQTLCGIEGICGMRVPQQQKEDYTAIWRYIGWMMGVPTSDQPSMPIHHKSYLRANNSSSSSSNNNNTTDDDNDSSAAKNRSTILRSMPPLDPCGPGPFHECSPKHYPPDTLAHSMALLESMTVHLLHPDASSIRVAHHLLRTPSGPAMERKRKTYAAAKKESRRHDDYDDDTFYLRVLIFRRFLGDTFADSMQLPKRHPDAWKHRWINCQSILVMAVLRVYTLVALLSPLVRDYVIIPNHRHIMLRFHKKWTQHHTTKMAKALRDGTRPKFSMNRGNSNDNANANSKCEHNIDRQQDPHESSHTAGSPPSACPFAMVASPND